MKEITCGHSTDLVYRSIDQKIGQNVSLDEVLDDCKLGSLGS